MTRLTGGWAAAVLVMGVLADPASAQLDGNPVYAINPGVGVTFAADFAGGLNSGSGKAHYFGGRVVVGVPTVSFWAGAGRVDMRNPDPTVDDKEITIGGGAAINLIKAPVFPVALTVQVGGATASCGSDCSDVYLIAGPALKVNLPTPGVGVEPWVMPRVHLSRRRESAETVMRTGIGASGGLNVSLPIGLGIYAAVDLARFPARNSGTLTVLKATPMTAGIGIHYKIAVPSLGMPLVPVVN